MDRRRLLAAMAAVAVAPRAGLAAAAKRVAILSISGPETESFFAPALKGLADRGWRRGSRLEVSFHVVDAPRPEALENHARAAVESRPDAILTISTQATSALLRHTTSIPIVTSVGDPVGSGFAASISAPGGNVTGASQGFEVSAVKGVEALRSLVPGLRRIATFHGDGNVSRRLAGEIAKAAREQGVEPHAFQIDGESGLRAAFDEARRLSIPAGCWLIQPVDAGLGAAEAVKRRFPLVSIGLGTTEAGVLASFFSTFPDMLDRMAAVLARVLSGESPGKIPFEQPREFSIELNMRTARAIQLAIPPGLRVRATRVVE